MVDSANDYGAQYNSELERYNRLMREALCCLNLAVEIRGVVLHSASGRVKARSEFLEKIMRKSYDDPFTQMPDIAGLRLVCLFESQLSVLDEAIRDAFRVHRVEDLTKVIDPSTFGYASIHYDCEIDDRYGTSRFEGIRDTPFEVQIRTIAMDTWANVSHHVEYKPQESTLPPRLRRELHALSGVLHLVDAHFEKIYGEVHRAPGVSPLSPASGAGTWAPIDQEVLTEYLQARYANRSIGDGDEVATLTRVLSESGYRTMRDLELLLIRAEEASLRYEADFPLRDSATYTSPQLVRTALLLGDSVHRNASLGTSAPRFATDRAISALAERYVDYEAYLKCQ